MISKAICSAEGEGKLRFQTSTALWLYPFMEKASGVNLEAKSGAGVLKAACVVLPIPATLLEPVELALAFTLDNFSDMEGGICWLGNSLSSILFYPGFVLWRGDSSFSYSVEAKPGSWTGDRLYLSSVWKRLSLSNWPH